VIHFDLATKQEKVDEINRIMEEPGFWNRPQEETQKYVTELNGLKGLIDEYNALKSRYEDTVVMIEMANEEEDRDSLEELKQEVESFKEDLETMRLDTLLTGEYDRCNCILTLHAGAGGTESMDWCGMLSRMYQKWCDKKGYKVQVIDFLEGDDAGYKSITLQIDGMNAYGHLKSEKGVHRLVRISPFNAAGKRETSFVSCDVMPDIDTEINIEINPADIEFQAYHSSGAGGQHVNKSSSAVRLTHKPTGIVVTCQMERSQLQNKNKALQMLKEKLYMMEQEANAEKLSGIQGVQKGINFGSQIRSYVLQPYTMVKDTRTDAQTSNAQAVLDGSIDLFINAYLAFINQKPEEQNGK
jgi:peptide chain release factor 2